MPIKKIIISFCVLLLIALVFKNQKSPTNNSVVYEKSIASTNKPNKIINNDIIKSAIKPQNALNDDEIISTITPIYDVDPVVDAQLIINNNMFCYRHLSKAIKDKKYLNKFELQLDKKQKRYLNNYVEYCQQLNQQKPELSLTDIDVLTKQKKSAPATSLWGRIINGETQVSDLSDSEISSLLKQNDLNILSESQNFLQKYYQEVIHWQLEDALQNHQYDYTYHIRHYAHQLYLGQIGSDCSPNTNIMAMLCYLNSQSCGLDYPQYISRILTSGQQADIQLALNYLKTQYQ